MAVISSTKPVYHFWQVLKNNNDERIRKKNAKYFDSRAPLDYLRGPAYNYETH